MILFSIVFRFTYSFIIYFCDIKEKELVVRNETPVGPGSETEMYSAMLDTYTNVNNYDRIHLILLNT